MGCRRAPSSACNDVQTRRFGDPVISLGGGPDLLEDPLACGTLPCGVIMSGPSHSRQARKWSIWSMRLRLRRYESRPVSPRTAPPIYPRRGPNELVNLPARRSETSSMKRVALGVGMHSGWGVLVAVTGDANSLEVVDRRRIVTADPGIPGAKQPYHHAASLGVPESERYLADCAAVSERLVLAAVGGAFRELDGHHYRIVGSAILWASGRLLPSLSNILASHALIHAAEGEFFRNAVRKACEGLNISVTAFQERELEERAKTAFGNAASRVQRGIASLGRSVGPPWTKDHKTAALAASMILARAETVASPPAAQRGRPLKIVCASVKVNG